MIANSAFLAAMILLIGVLELLSELTFLAPFKRLIIGEHLSVILASVVVVFLNLFAAIYWLGRRLWLKDTGRKLEHIERQLRTTDTVVRDLTKRLSTEE